MSEVRVEYGAVSRATGKPWLNTFETENQANEFIFKRPNPSDWKVVSRKVTYGEWRDI